MTKFLACNHKHTTVHPTDEQWACPSCGGGLDVFYIDESVNDECALLHNEDRICCTKCHKDWTGKKFVSLLLKQTVKHVCDHCKGTGFIIMEKKKS